MLTGKQRSYLRGLANGIDSIFHVGKNGIDEAFVKALDEALTKRELVKVTLLPNSDMNLKEASETLCKKLHCEGVQRIGSKIVLYRKSEEDPKIQIPY